MITVAAPPAPNTDVPSAPDLGASGSGWSADQIADLLEVLNDGHEWLVSQLDLIAGQQALVSRVLVRQLERMVAGYGPADAARSRLASLTCAELFDGLAVFCARRDSAGSRQPELPVLQLHRGGRA